MQEFAFYQSFLDLVAQENKKSKEIKGKTTSEQDKMMNDASFRKFLIEKAGRLPSTVKAIAPYLSKKIIKPQQLIHDDPDYYIACDMVTNTYYVCYRELLMVDIDFYKEHEVNTATPEDRCAEIIRQIEAYCETRPTLRFRLYRSQNGVHAFLISSRSIYCSDASLSLMLDLGADFYYVVFSYLRGWSVRLNRKRRDRSSQLYTLIRDIGSGNVDSHCEKLVQLHINLVPVFKDVDVSLMYGGPHEI